jgi:hypothetical protein
MSFTPPYFNDFGKSYNDLAKKKYDYKNSAKLTNKTSNGLTLETTGFLNESSVSAKAKVTQKDPAFGETELNLCTASGAFTTQAKAKKLVDGATFTVSGGYCPPKKGSSNTGFYAKAAADYNQEFFAGKASLKFSDRLAPASAGFDVSASGVIGFQGLSVGGQVDLDSNASLKDYNLGVQYTAGDFTGTLQTRERADIIDASWYHKVNRNQTAGVQFTTNPFAGSKQLTFATQYELDVDTTLKAKANSNGVLSAAVEHRLQNPRLKYNVAGEFNSVGAGIPKASKFGLGFSFGDY